MSLSPQIREQVRQRASFACEFCTVSEIDAGGQLTIDHFQPTSKGGDDTLDNLLYACIRCNQYKQDYWPTEPKHLSLWNPRKESRSEHFLELSDGSLVGLTLTGQFTLSRLRLNRAPLVQYRLHKRKRQEEAQLLVQYKDMIQLLTQLNQQLVRLVDQQQTLLENQSDLLQLLLHQSDD